jgi:uncharacterized protein YwgA
MNHYQLAKLVEWAGTLRSRKRLQKVVYLLQAAGCPLDADFFLHYYGPYSQEVALLANEMAREKLLEETTTGTPPHEQYNYQITESTRKQMAELEASPRGAAMLRELLPFEAKARRLLSADLKQVEYASTIAYFYRQDPDWAQAVEKAVTYKNDEAVRAALSLAQEAIG